MESCFNQKKIKGIETCADGDTFLLRLVFGVVSNYSVGGSRIIYYSDFSYIMANMMDNIKWFFF